MDYGKIEKRKRHLQSSDKAARLLPAFSLPSQAQLPTKGMIQHPYPSVKET
jgi:hypothetical protein